MQTIKRSHPYHLKDDEQINQFQIDEITNSILEGDAFSLIRKIPSESVDLVFFDPPYFLQLPRKKLYRWKVNTQVIGVDEKWDKFGSFEQYDNFIENLLAEIQRVLKPTGTLWAIATYHSIYRIGSIMQNLGFWILNDVIWMKNNPMPNWLSVRFTNATETLIWAVKDKSAKGYSFHKNFAKGFGIGKVGANVWLIPLCSGKERIKDDKGEKVHPTQKPVELLRRVILTSSTPGDIVLDPLAGVGTTGYTASKLGRRFIMIEENPKYIEAALHRFNIDMDISSDPVKKETGSMFDYLFGDDGFGDP